MNKDEINMPLGGDSNRLAEAAKLFQSELNPLKGLLSQQDMLKDLAFHKPVMPEMFAGNQNLASEFYKRLSQWIRDFDSSLDQDHEVGVRLASFGQSVTFHLHDMGYWDPSLISFKGITDRGDPVELIQHVSQISVLLIKVKRANPAEPKRSVGFAAWEDETKT